MITLKITLVITRVITHLFLHGLKNHLYYHVITIEKYITGRKINFFFGSHLALKYFKVVANSKKFVAIMTHTKNNFYPFTVLDRLNCS